jgi:UDP-2,4-diacetamido-2,4,6-trideoxy-beta-L-altropyranose hydrolase
MALGCRRASMGDADVLWRWANDPVTRANAFSRAPIPYAVHLRWLAGRLCSEATRIWIFSDGGTPVGQVRVDRAGAAGEIDICVTPGHRGQGYGRAMLAEAVRRAKREWGAGVRPRAQVLDRNPASLALFRGCGFRIVGRVERGAGRGAVVLEGA